MEPLEFERVSVADAGLAFHGDPTLPGAHKRQRNGEEPLLGVTRAWIASLPADIRPGQLARQYPRILNRLRHLWKQTARCEAYMDSLLVDRRPTPREGFPHRIVEELELLRDYHASLYPRAPSLWDHA